MQDDPLALQPARERQQLLHDARAAVGAGLHRGGDLLQILGGRTATQQGGRHQDGGQNVVQIMGDPAGQPADALHALGLKKLIPKGSLLRGIHERDHRSLELAVPQHRAGAVIDRERGAVLPPETLAGHTARRPAPKGLVDGTLIDRVGLPVDSGMVEQAVHVLAERLLGGVAEHACGGPVDERATPLEVHPVNPLAGRLEQQAHELGQLLTLALGATTLADVDDHGSQRDRVSPLVRDRKE